jgi:TonB family protein
MSRRTRPPRRLLLLNLAALALILHACALSPRLIASQQPAAPRARAAPDPSAYLGTVSKEWLLYALRAREADEAALVRLVERRGAESFPTAEDERELRAAGATDRLLEAVRKHTAPPPPSGGGYGPGTGRVGVGDPRAVGRPGGGGPGVREAVDYTRPFRQSEVTRRARITFNPQPGYTEEARRNNVSGFVRLRAVLNSSGEVTDIGVVKGLPDGLTEKAVAAARQIKFTHAEKDGRKVSQHVVLEYAFDVPLGESDVDERAIILEKPEPAYTEEARRHNVRGKVVLRVTLTSFGRAAVDSVEAGLPHGLTEKAVEAAQRVVFEPARLGGTHVSQRATLEYHFAP